ncbi:MAG: helix-turn-helix domain-containing protein [Caldilineaceae bacterium]
MPPDHLNVESISHRSHHTASSLTFGALLQQLRRRAGMTQTDLAAAVDFSVSHISNLEKNQRLPAVTLVLEKFVPALGLQDEPRTAQQLLELAAIARGERLPPDFYQRLSLPAATHLPIANHSPTNLPLPLLPILGRERDLTVISNRLLGHQGRLFTLIGPPGIGKTTLGLAVAARLQTSFEDGVYFAPLAPVTDPAHVGPALMNVLGLTESSARSPQVRLTEYLRRKRLLIFLDNFEQITAATPFLLSLLQECPGLHFLVTSRAALRVRAEQRFKVAALDTNVAVELFVQRAQAVEPDFALTTESAPLVEQICLRLDCLPLAIELIATQIHLFTPQGLLTRLQAHSLDLLYNDAPDLEPRHQTLRRAIQQSYALLSPEEQAFFRLLGVFSGSFDLPAIEALWQTVQSEHILADNPAPLLAALVNKSFVQTEPQVNQQRFKLLETLREYALEQMQLHGELEAARRRHAQYFCQLAEIANPLLRGPDEILWLDRLEANHDNFRAAIAWSLDSPPDLATGLHLVGVLWWFWYVRSYMREGLDWLQRALAKEGSNFPALRAKILQGICAFIWVNHFPDREGLSRPWIEESIALYRQLDDPWNLAYSLGYLGFSVETPAAFEPALQEAQQLFAQIDDRWGQAWVRIMEYWVARPYVQHVALEESVQMMRAIGSKFTLALLLGATAVKAFQIGNYEQARAAAEESIFIFQQVGEKWTRANNLFLLGDILAAQNQPERLAEIYAEGLLLAQQSGSRELETRFRQRQEWLKQQMER